MSPFSSLTDSEIRDYCRATVESLEHWLRRLIHDKFSDSYGSQYYSVQNANGDYLFNSEIRKYIETRMKSEPDRYARPIDAVLFDHTIAIVCNPLHYKTHFKDALSIAFPNGFSEARTILQRLVQPRNRLSHGNPISIRDAERITCYSHDVIDSLKEYYARLGKAMEYNVPSILKVTDSFGNVAHVSELPHSSAGQVAVDFTNDPKCYLYPGDRLAIEVEMDPAFPPETYTLRWHTPKATDVGSGHKLELLIVEEDIMVSMWVQCWVYSDKKWHKYGDRDEVLLLYYKVLPNSSQ